MASDDDSGPGLAIMLGTGAEPAAEDGDEPELDLRGETKRAAAAEAMGAMQSGDADGFERALERFVRACMGSYDEE